MRPLLLVIVVEVPDLDAKGIKIKKAAFRIKRDGVYRPINCIREAEPMALIRCSKTYLHVIQENVPTRKSRCWNHPEMSCSCIPFGLVAYIACLSSTGLEFSVTGYSFFSFLFHHNLLRH